MENKHIFILIIGLTASTVLLVLFLFFYYCRKAKEFVSDDVEGAKIEYKKEKDGVGKEELMKFDGGEEFSIDDILEAPGEVIGKSSYGTLYKASIVRSNSVVMLRFLRPACTLRMKEVLPVIEFLGSVRHPNLVPLHAFYAGDRGEKLLVHPYYGDTTLAQLIKDGNAEVHKWLTIYTISIGIARALDHLHTAFEIPLIHGNLKSKNIILDHKFEPFVSDFGLHLLLNFSAGLQMLETSAAQGYKAPELVNMKDVSEECDIYSLGVIFLELLTGRQPIDPDPDSDQELHLPNAVRLALLDHSVVDLCHPGIFLHQSDDRRAEIEDSILLYFQLAMACCSPAPSVRPGIKQVVGKLEELARQKPWLSTKCGT